MRLQPGCIALGFAVLLSVVGCASPPSGTVDDPWPSSAPGSGTSNVPSDESSPSGHVAADWARARIGSPYQWGGTGSGGFDCSGLVQAAFSRMGISLPRTTQDQAKRGQMVARDAIRPGDLIFFGSSASAVDHVGIAAGDDRFVHASSSRGVVEDSLGESRYFRNRYVFARRITTQTASHR